MRSEFSENSLERKIINILTSLLLCLTGQFMLRSRQQLILVFFKCLDCHNKKYNNWNCGIVGPLDCCGWLLLG